MEKKIAIALAALMVAALAAPAVMADNVPYSATVTGGQSTTVTTSNGAFGSVETGSGFETNVITASINCTNVGTDAASVAAKFLTNNGTIYGLVNDTNVIGGSNFMLGNATFNALNDEGTDVMLTDGVPAGANVAYHAKLQVPAGQALGSYTGTVQLTFS